MSLSLHPNQAGLEALRRVAIACAVESAPALDSWSRYSVVRLDLSNEITPVAFANHGGCFTLGGMPGTKPASSRMPFAALTLDPSAPQQKGGT